MAQFIQTEFDWGRESTLPRKSLVDVPSEPAMTQAMLPAITEEKTDSQPVQTKARRGPVALPVPKPLPAAIGRGHFGEDEHGPIRPSPAEVRAITEAHTDRLVNLLEGLSEVESSLANSQCSDRARLYHEKDRLQGAYRSALAMYAEDFGEVAANRLDAWARHCYDHR